LLFAHWSVPAETLRPHVPAGLDLDTAEGSAWVSAVAFRMCRVRPRFLPPLGLVSNFLELNLRTYVWRAGKPGVYFLSIHAGSPLAVFVSRRLSPLPYVRARMTFSRDQAGIRFACKHAWRDGSEFSVQYRPDSAIYDSLPGSLDAWLTERYCMYVGTSQRGLLLGEIHHPRWRLQHVRAEVSANTLGRPFGLDLSRPADLLHYSAGVQAIAWSFEALGERTKVATKSQALVAK
jgi:uncharacterized protein YqjF (DUF2071 family)